MYSTVIVNLRRATYVIYFAVNDCVKSLDILNEYPRFLCKMFETL